MYLENDKIDKMEICPRIMNPQFWNV